MRNIKWIALTLALVLLGGCASVPMASKDHDAQAKEFTVQKNQSNIYLYRNENIGGAIAIPVMIDGRVAGKTAAKTYFLWSVPPGKHEIVSMGENTEKITLDTKAGKNYFVWQEIKMGMWQPRTLLHVMNEEDGRKAVMECSLAAESTP